MDTLTRILQHGGHPGGSASTLRILRDFAPAFRPTDLILSSKGHDAAAFLSWQVERGELPASWLDRYRTVNGYPGHPERGVTPGALVSTGSLGMGLSKAVGLAYANRDRRVIVIVGDGELQEGQVWEALQSAARQHVDNLIVLLDHNGAQSDNRPLPTPSNLHPEGIFKAAAWSVHPIEAPHYTIPQVTGWPMCVLVHGRKVLPHALAVRSPLVDAYRTALQDALQRDERLIVLEADLAYDHGLEELGDAFPGRVVSCGISEQHMVSMAVGLAAEGLVPITHTFARFYLRAAEQIYDALREPGLAIRFVAGLAGPLPVGPGPSHEIDEDAERMLFRCGTFTPTEPADVAGAVRLMLRQPRSTYLRLVAQPELV
jgi:transketolase N-terminal domain/subunit